MAKPGPQKRTGLSVREYVAHRAELGLVGANKSAVQKALKSGRISYIGGDSRKGIDPETADAAWEANTSPARRHTQAHDAARESLEGRVENGLPTVRDANVPDYQVSRARREHYQAELSRLELGEKLGQLVQTEAVAQQVQAMTGNVRQVLLTFPARVAPLLVAAGADLEDLTQRAQAVELELGVHIRDLLERWQADPTGAKSKPLEDEEAAG